LRVLLLAVLLSTTVQLENQAENRFGNLCLHKQDAATVRLLDGEPDDRRTASPLRRKAAPRDWDDDLLSCALSAIAAAKGQTAVAEAVLELNPDISIGF